MNGPSVKLLDDVTLPRVAVIEWVMALASGFKPSPRPPLSLTVYDARTRKGKE